MNKREQLNAAVSAASAELDAAAKAIETAEDYSAFIGNPGIRSTGRGTPEAEKRFADARVAYIRASKALYAYTYGPALREYYFGR